MNHDYQRRTFFKSHWLQQLSRRVGPRKLELEVGADNINCEHLWEDCVICKTPTCRWLMPENAPLCSDECKDKYLENPKVYDPRGLYEEAAQANG